MKFIKLITFVLITFSTTLLSAKQPPSPSNIKTITVQSASMNKGVNVIVVLPEDYDRNKETRYPVIYLLHGFGDNHTTWTSKTKPSLHKIATRENIIFVCPDGSTSFYWDAPKNPAFKYETFVSKELIEFIDKNYRTIATKQSRAITGFSMGGHGSLWLAFRHTDVFGSCGSMSGAVDIRIFPFGWKIPELLGDYANNEDTWDEHMVINQLHKLNPQNMPSIIIDCGTKDFLYNVNQAFHKKMLYMRIPHEYITRPGGHTHAYWNNAVDTHIAFFLKRFAQK